MHGIPVEHPKRACIRCCLDRFNNNNLLDANKMNHFTYTHSHGEPFISATFIAKHSLPLLLLLLLLFRIVVFIQKFLIKHQQSSSNRNIYGRLLGNSTCHYFIDMVFVKGSTFGLYKFWCTAHSVSETKW